ncbi:MAG: hypothetical protein WCF65_04620 [Parachlamydiaceae bacterium]
MEKHEYDDDYEDFPIAYSIDNAILMHRDAHFGGDFATMLRYYKEGGSGVDQDFDIERIEELARMERAQGSDLAPLMLSGAEAEKVADARKAYRDLRELCENNTSKSPVARLIAELVLSESEELPAAIQAVVAEKTAIVPALIDLMRSEEFHDPLFPGYGDAPALAAECLGLIGDKRAIISLFEAIGNEDFFNEDIVFDALKAIGAPAKEFLLRVLHSRPITGDNERAAVALMKFRYDPEVATACLKMLQEIDLNKYLPLATYLVLACEGVSTQQEKDTLRSFGDNPSTPKTLRLDIAAVLTHLH